MERSINDGLDYSGDAAAGTFFSSDFKKNDDLKQMLDSNRDNLKLEAMKRIIAMVAKGRDASDLFPAVVKNVVSKNAEVKKLVYVYLMRYAEEQQDLALLSISTFQRALKDPNQLIRASALRVLSSIRVPVIVPIVMLAIRDASGDMSPYVRKTAAHAIPKLYSLDPDQKDELVQIVDKLLADRTTLVMGSAVMAFEEICPERIDLIHKNYRKLCSLMVDIDEWGQVVVLNMLARYARTQFVNPNEGDITADGEEKPFYDDDDEEEQKEEDESDAKPPVQMDPDHRLLLKTSRPLLQSRNAAVVMAVVQLYHHLAPKSEVALVVKALIRLLRSHVEVQTVVLTCIAAMSTNRKSLFEPYMKSFFVRSSDSTQVKLLKLEILTNIANESNIPPILQEFQTYISSQDKKFVAATIQAIGRCASNIKEVAETCLNGLVSLLSHPDSAVVGGAVVVAKTLLQTQKSGNKPVIAKLAKMVDRVTVAPARAAILWLLGEHCERLPKLPPDVLRKMAKSFPDEEDIVKLQIMSLAAKLQLTNPSQTTLLCQYILNLAKYDTSYDIRDRARFLRQLLFPENPEKMKLPKLAKKILLSSKPAPILQSKFKDRDSYQLGSLSHFINSKANGYQDLPDFPETAPDPSVRDVEPPPTSQKSHGLSSDKGPGKKSDDFYGGSSNEGSGSESGSASGSGTEDSEEDSESGSESGSESSSCDSGSSSDESDQETSKSRKTLAKNKIKIVRNTEAQNKASYEQYSDDNGDGDVNNSSGASSSSGSSSSESSSSSSSEDEAPVKKVSEKKKPVQPAAQSKPVNKKDTAKQKSNVDQLLLDFDSFEDTVTSSGNAQSSFASLSEGILSPSAPMSSSVSKAMAALDSLETASAKYIPTKTIELVNKLSSGGLQVTSRFTRSPHILSTTAVSVELGFLNTSKETLRQIRVGEKVLPQGMSVWDFAAIDSLLPDKSVTSNLGIDFHDTTQGAKVEILWGTEVEPNKRYMMTIKAPVGELVQPVTMSEARFVSEQGKLRGMNEHEGKTLVKRGTLGNSVTSLVQKVYETANLLQVPSTQDDLVRFAGQTVSNRTLVLLTLHLPSDFTTTSADDEISLRFVVNCEKIVVGSMLLQELKEALK